MGTGRGDRTFALCAYWRKLGSDSLTRNLILYLPQSKRDIPPAKRRTSLLVSSPAWHTTRYKENAVNGSRNCPFKISFPFPKTQKGRFPKQRENILDQLPPPWHTYAQFTLRTILASQSVETHSFCVHKDILERTLIDDYKPLVEQTKTVILTDPRIVAGLKISSVSSLHVWFATSSVLLERYAEAVYVLKEYVWSYLSIFKEWISPFKKIDRR